jgi:hypothetical protein
MTAGIESLPLAPGVLSLLRAQLPTVAERTIEAITREVPEYAALGGEVGETIQQAVQLALATFLRRAARSTGAQDDDPTAPALEGAYALGRGEARSGRTMDALLTAYRVGARVSWRLWSATAVADGLPAEAVARFAELVFAYIDELSAASAAGHTDELARSGRVRQRYLERLGVALLTGAEEPHLVALAQQADWPPPETLTAVLLPPARVRSTLALFEPRTLALTGDVAGLDDLPEETAVLLVADVHRTRGALLRALAAGAVVGPARPWARASTSYRRALRLAELLAGRSAGPLSDGPLDTEQHLPELVLTADPEALADLRRAALAPLAGLRPETAERLGATLRSWLLHQGRREDVAAHLHVHPQTVRYRMTQLRELFGNRLLDPQAVLELTLALAPAGLGSGPGRSSRG